MGSLRCILLATTLALAPGAVRAAPPPPFAAAPAAPPPAPTGAVAQLDRLIALVDGTPVWLSTLKDALALVPTPPDDASLRQAADAMATKLVDDVLIAKQAKKMRIEVEEAEVDEAVKVIAKQNNLDAAGLDAALAQMGTTMARYRLSLREQLVDLRAFRVWLDSNPAIDKAPDKLPAAHDHWTAELRRHARIEVK